MNAHEFTTSKMSVALCALALAAQACAVDTSLPEDFEDSDDRDDELTKQSYGEAASTVTFYSEAGLWGDSLAVDVVPSTVDETVRLIRAPEFGAQSLLNRVSSVRLKCGSRSSKVVLFSTNNSSTKLSDWHDYNEDGRPLSCAPYQTVDLNLHAQAAPWADDVHSAYFLADARLAAEVPFSTLLENGWNQALEDLPSGAEAEGGPELKLTGSRSFELHQELELDDAFCGNRYAEFDLRAQMDSSGVFDVIVLSSYVDTGWGDAWGCRTQMQKQLISAAQEATYDLEDALVDLMALGGDHPRYYLVPDWGLDEFRLHSGGEAPKPPRVYEKR